MADNSLCNLELLKNHYQYPGNHRLVYQALCAVITKRGADIQWQLFTPEDWLLFEIMAYRERVNSLVYTAWKGDKLPANLPKKVWVGISARYFEAQQKQQIIFNELKERILPALMPAVSPIVLLKGSALVPTLYKNPALRPMIDIDVLVPDDKVDEAVKRLVNLGYCETIPNMGTTTQQLSNYHVHLACHEPQMTIVEVHRAINPPLAGMHNADMDWFWHDIEPVGSYDFMTCYMLSPTANLLHLSAHLMLQHGEAMAGLYLYYDIHLLLSQWGDRIDWQEAISETAKMNWSAALYKTLIGTRDLFGTNLITQYIEKLRDDSKKETLRYIDDKANTKMETITFRVWLSLRNLSWPKRLKWLLEVFFPSASYMRWRYKPHPDWLWPIYYPVRIGRGFYDLFVKFFSESKKAKNSC